MKKIYLILSLTILLFSCSSLELEAVPSSNDETLRILAMGLSHEENLSEAKKLSSEHMIKVVTLQLTNAYDEKIQAEIDLLESRKFSDLVSISEDGSIFSSAEVSETISGVLATNTDLLKYIIYGSKDISTGLIDHEINLSVVHNSKNKREYLSYNFCDEWNNCDDINNKIDKVSVIASNCNNTSCNYTELMQLKMSDIFLRNASEKGLFLRLKSKKKTHKIKISSVYLSGYLEVAK